MKKVMALVLAVLMMATVAFAAVDRTSGGENNAKYKANVTPGSSVKIDQDGVATSGVKVVAYSSKTDAKIYKDSNVFNTSDGTIDEDEPMMLAYEEGDLKYNIADVIFRAVTNENYAVTGVKSRIGRSLVKGVEINDKEERVEVKLVDDLNNTTAKDFEVDFTLKGKGKFTLKTDDETELYNLYTGLYTKATSKDKPADIDANGYVLRSGAKKTGDRVTLPNVKFHIAGTVGYGKVEIYLGDDTDEDLEDIDRVQGVNLDDDVVKFKNGNDIGDWNRVSGTPNRTAGAFVADAILTQHYGDAMTMEARVYSGDTLYFGVDNDPDRDIIDRLADSDADMDFYFFNDDIKFTTFNSNVKLYFNDAEETDFVYAVNKDNKLVPTGNWSEEDGCWVVKTRTLGKYIISDVELKEFEAAAGDANPNPDTGANDVVGIAAALAAVALVSAAAVSLKK